MILMSHVLQASPTAIFLRLNHLQLYVTDGCLQLSVQPWTTLSLGHLQAVPAALHQRYAIVSNVESLAVPLPPAASPPSPSLSVCF